MPEPTKEWKLKKDEESGQVVFDGEKPVYINPEGKEVTLDPVGMYSKIIDLGKENKKHRERADALSQQISVFEGVEDLAEWKQKADDAIKTVENFNDKDWMKADKVEKLKADMEKAYEKKLEDASKSFGAKEQNYLGIVSKKDGQIYKLMISSKFSSDSHFSGKSPKTNLRPEIAEAFFGKHFRPEEDNKTGELQLRAYYDDATKEDLITSLKNPGEPADFHEAIEILIDRYPNKDSLISSTGTGSGSGGGSNGDDGDESDELARLKKQMAAAKEAKDSKKMIALRNQIFKIENKR